MSAMNLGAGNRTEWNAMVFVFTDLDGSTCFLCPQVLTELAFPGAGKDESLDPFQKRAEYLHRLSKSDVTMGTRYLDAPAAKSDSFCCVEFSWTLSLSTYLWG